MNNAQSLAERAGEILARSRFSQISRRAMSAVSRQVRGSSEEIRLPNREASCFTMKARTETGLQTETKSVFDAKPAQDPVTSSHIHRADISSPNSMQPERPIIVRVDFDRHAGSRLEEMIAEAVERAARETLSDLISDARLSRTRSSSSRI